ncbi:MAG: hypothetical protein V2A73_01135 [Pseudomonadota bacterium]
MLLPDERRRRRSQWTGDALHYQLDSVAMRESLLAIVLADHDGLLVAGSRRGPDMEELAAVAPLVARRERLAPGEIASARHLPAAVGMLVFDEKPMYVFALGNQEHARAGIAAASHGVRRILSMPA